MTYREARSLQTLLAEVNAAAPKRSKRSDGWIGDAAHSSRTSDHNPNSAGVVRARDFTHDPKGGLDAGALANHLAGMLGKHPALGRGAYVIFNRRIISTSRLGEGWRTYTGSNPHTAHVHLSVGTTGYDSTQPFGWPPKKAPTYPAVRRFLRAKTRTARLAALRKVTGKGAKKHAQKWLAAEVDRVAAARAVKQAKARKKAARKALRQIVKG